MTDKKTYSVSEAAERLGVIPRTVQVWIRKGRFPHAYKLDPFGKRSSYRIPVEDIEAFEEARRMHQASKERDTD